MNKFEILAWLSLRLGSEDGKGHMPTLQELSEVSPNAEIMRIAKQIEERYSHTCLPNPGQSCGIAQPSLWKSAALFFDRIWVPPMQPELMPPESIIFYAATDSELLAVVVAMARPELLAKPSKPVPNFVENAKATFAATLATRVKANLGIDATCVYDSQMQRDTEYVPGDRAALVSIISNVNVISPDSLSWDQVLHFRDDKDAVNKLRRLKRWLDSDMSGKSLSAIQDEICIRVEDYEAAMKTHAIKTVLGSLESLFDSETFKTLGFAGGIAATLGTMAGGVPLGEIAGMGTAISVGIGKVVVNVRQKLVDFKDLKRTTNPEIAYVIELQKAQAERPVNPNPFATGQ